jgi:hypothetical protein
MVMLPRAILVVPAMALALAPGLASAEEHSIIRNSGDHPHYVFEAEPHALLGFGPGPFDEPGGSAFGVGFRGTFHIADGFVSSINDSVGVGVGADFAFGNDTRVWIPVVLQWNFWLSTHWSVFGEPGLGIAGGPHSGVWPALYLGGRYSFTERIAMTRRTGYQDISLDMSYHI